MSNLEGDSKFQISAKDPTAESLETWRKKTFSLNPTRRFRHVKNLSVTSEPMEEARRKLKVGVKATQAAFLFVTAGKKFTSAGKTKEELAGFGASISALQDIGTDANAFSKLGKVSGIANKLKVSTERGIDGSETDLRTRRDVYGANVFTEKPPQGFWTFVWEASQDLTLMILIVCAFVSLAVGIPTEGLKEGWYDGVGILLSILIVVFITAINDYRQSLQFRDLDKEKKKILIQVTRGGRRQKVFIFDLVVGDIVHLSIGDQIPADGVYVSGYSLTIDESSLTGESEPVLVSEGKPFLRSGTQVRDGSGVMLVIGVGMNTEWGILMSTLSEEGDDETPLQVKLNGVATRIGKIGLGFAIVTFAVLLTRFFSQKDELNEWSMEDLVQVIDYFAIAVTIVVVAVPEGLPLAVTLSLAYAMKQMIRDKALVRRLSACETMGSATCICSDKTGTLTTNQMTVVKALLCGKLHTTQESRADISDAALEAYLECAFQNTNGDVAEHGNALEFLGSPTETAILRFGVDLGGCFRDVRGKSKIVRVEPFNSVKKRMAVLIHLVDGRYRVLCKGASEIVLRNCTNVLGSDGQVGSLDAATMDSMLRVTQEFAGEALRTLCFAYKDLERLPEAEDSLPCDDGMTCVAIIGIKDPVRPGVKEAVSMCFKAGIKVRMVTGDNIETAKAIARECGILMDGGLAVEGQVLRHWSPDEMKEKVPLLQVIARSSPSDKLKLVQFLKESGEVVAVTGDGTNDAPALHEADIGLAMGIAGTEVAKGSADVIILDDNFSTIVTVAKWGRSIYTNIQKFVQFQLTVNLVALVVNFTSACLTGRAPLTAVQLLWVNLIMDTLGALALATEPPYDELMEKKPVGRSGTFITVTMWRNIFGQAVYQLIVLWVMQFKGKELLHLNGDDAQKVLDTMIFNTFVFCQIFNEINSREMEKLNVFKHTLNNNIFIGVIISTVLFQVMMVEFLGKLANTVHLSQGQWSISVIIGFFSLLVALAVKVLPAPSMSHVKYLLKNRVILGGIFCLLLSQVVKIELTKVLSKEQWLIFGLIFVVTSVLAVMVRLLPGSEPKSKAE